MSPLWSDMALARAARANAADFGLVDRQPDRRQAETAITKSRDLPRRPIRRSVSSFAL
ncbi:MAG TPA: hypothetical protein VFK50_09570 [Sphingomicrobium sp.]|nr:hypothetical protein [Sphingomicrobium sp.]